MKFIGLFVFAILTAFVMADSCTTCEKGMINCGIPCISSYESGNPTDCVECLFGVVEPCCDCIARNNPVCNYTMVAKQMDNRYRIK